MGSEMRKLTIMDAAQTLGISKEAIHNRIRRGSLQSVVEDGVKYVFLEDQEAQKKANTSAQNKTNTQTSERYYRFLEEQNQKLQNRVETLENETRSLREQKELMLIQEREKIEQIYKQKDEQLKNILHAIASKFMLEAPVIENENIEHVEAVIEEPKLISLKKYLKKKNYSEKKIKKIKAKFQKLSKKEERIICIDKKYYLDLAHYDYEDILL